MGFVSEQVVVPEGEQVQLCLLHLGNLERDVDFELNYELESLESKLLIIKRLCSNKCMLAYSKKHATLMLTVSHFKFYIFF